MQPLLTRVGLALGAVVVIGIGFPAVLWFDAAVKALRRFALIPMRSSQVGRVATMCRWGSKRTGSTRLQRHVGVIFTRDAKGWRKVCSTRARTSRGMGVSHTADDAAVVDGAAAKPRVAQTCYGAHTALSRDPVPVPAHGVGGGARLCQGRDPHAIRGKKQNFGEHDPLYRCMGGKRVSASRGAEGQSSDSDQEWKAQAQSKSLKRARGRDREAQQHSPKWEAGLESWGTGEQGRFPPRTFTPPPPSLPPLPAAGCSQMNFNKACCQANQ